MAINFNCPKCGQSISAAAETAGTQTACPGCGELVPVPADPTMQPCPVCGKQLRLSEKLHGRRVRCKACETVLLVSADPWGLTAAETSPSAAAPATPAPAAPKPAAPKPAAPKAAAPKAPETPAAGGPPSMPAAGGPPTMPAAGGPPAMPAAGGPPSMPGAGGAPLIDTGPEGSSIAARARRKTPMWPFIAGGAAILVAALVTVGAVVLLGGGGIGKAINYLPDNSDFVASIDVDSLLDSKIYKKIKKENSAAIDQIEAMIKEGVGLSPDDVDRVTFGGKMSEEPIGVVELNKSVDPKELTGDNFKPEKHNGKTIYLPELGFDFALYFPDDKTMVLGEADDIKAILDRDGPPKLSEEFEDLIGELKGAPGP